MILESITVANDLILSQGPDALAVCRAHRGLPVGFLLLWYSV